MVTTFVLFNTIRSLFAMAHSPIFRLDAVLTSYLAGALFLFLCFSIKIISIFLVFFCHNYIFVVHRLKTIKLQ